jgi:hypothetical protein
MALLAFVIGVLVKNSISQKFLKFIILHINELLNKIYNISESGDVEFPFFEDSFIFTEFWKNEFFWNKSRFALVLVVSPMLLTNTRVNLQYPSSFSWFREIWIFRNSEISSRYRHFCEKTRFFKNFPNSIYLIQWIVHHNI